VSLVIEEELTHNATSKMKKATKEPKTSLAYLTKKGTKICVVNAFYAVIASLRGHLHEQTPANIPL
jgi:hypothetical protein